MAFQFTALGSAVGTFVQDVVTTVTPKVMLDNVVDVAKRYKPVRNVACFVTTAAGGGGGVPLFLYTPIHDYVAPIVLEIIPFAGKTAVDVGVGFVGFWVGGAVAYNVAKYTYREAARQYGGHPNSAYHFDAAKAEEIIDANPELYPTVAAPIPEHDDNAVEKSAWEKFSDKQKKRWAALRACCHGEQEADDDEEAGNAQKQFYIQKLMETLTWARSKIDEHKKDGTTKHKDYKYAFERVLRANDLDPLFELINSNLSARETRTLLAGNKASHIAEVDFNQFAEENASVNDAVLKPALIFSQNAARAQELTGPKVLCPKRLLSPKPLNAQGKSTLLASFDAIRTQELGKFEVERQRLPGEDDIVTKILQNRGFKTRVA